MNKDNKYIISLDNVSIGYNKAKPVLSNINQKAGKGELIAVVGSNGTGKSTLLRSIAKLQDTLSGNILLKGKKLDLWTRTELAQNISFVSTELTNVNNLKVIDLISLGRFSYTNWQGKLKENDKNVINKSIKKTGLENYKNRFFNNLSDGEKQRVMIARSLSQDTDLIILDEPTAFLDLPNKYNIVNLLFELTRTENKTIIFSIHDLNIAIKEVDKIWLINNNKIYEGSPEDLILNNTFSNIFANRNLSFNVKTGEFKSPVNADKDICIRGRGISYEWTKKAMERLRFTTECNKNTKIIVEVIDMDKKTEWHISNKENKYVCKSIYELSLILREIIKS